ncbi:MAG: hypothetical protein EOP54_00945 [Sphingobacteriales bacterium]|nr:MAG: hypothetical protein EOP54_00945 [Sphingobacteriales bacterium]
MFIIKIMLLMDMKHIFYSILFLTAFLSCKNTTSASLVQEQESVAADTKNKDNYIYTEVTGLKRNSDYSTASQMQKLELTYQSLTLKIRYIADRSYIALDNGKATSDWQQLKVNFYYDMSFAAAEKEIHLLLKDNDLTKGYVLFPAFTEQYASYFIYYFEKNALRYLGNYEAADFNKGAFAFNEQSREFYRSSDKGSKLTKIEQVDRASFDPVAADIKLLKSTNENGAKPAAINKEWLGTYKGSFLRLKEESADPRAWGEIDLSIGKESVKFHLDSYNENVAKEMKIVFADAQKIRLVAEGNDKQVLTLLRDKNKYQLSGSLIETIVGLREIYELDKK